MWGLPPGGGKLLCFLNFNFLPERTMNRFTPTNEEIADVLERIADLLQAQDTEGTNVFRVRAYRSAARTVQLSTRKISSVVLSSELKELEALPNVGKSIAASISELVHTGRVRLLERLQGELSSEELLTSVPGIGKELAHRIHHNMGIDSLEALEMAAHEGHLSSVVGIGHRRIEGIRDAVTAILNRNARYRARLARARERSQIVRQHQGKTPQPSVGLLLSVDREYRSKSSRGKLRKIAPRRFNPQKAAWLPIYHSYVQEWFFTAVYSNTARAHELGKTHDWVVIYYEKMGQEAQCTVVTETKGILKNERVVRGRESECNSYYHQIHHLRTALLANG